MSHAKIRTLRNGSLMVTGKFELQDVNGAEYDTDDEIYLCRCGQSARKPFCDGSHKGAGFASEPTVPVE